MSKKILVTETDGTNSDGVANYAIKVEEIIDEGRPLILFKESIYPLYECPEDATLERDMSFAYDLLTMFKLGLQLGKEGVEVRFIKEED